ncbi:MAG: glycosyltransferase family 2 protein [Luteolibacter sp.]
MQFTIITPNLNYGRFLGDCLGSVAAQTGVTLEHLVIDGGSTDESEEVTKAFPHAEWSQQPDKGMSDAINKGLARAKGDWVMWLNADDRLKAGALAEVAKFIAGHPEADVVYGSFDFVSESGEFLRRMKLFGWSPFVSVHHCCYVPSTACFMRRATALAEGCRLHPEFRYLMDGELYSRLHAMGKTFRYLPVTLADFRIHAENRSFSTDVGSRDMEEALKAERQHVESRVIRRVHGISLFADPYLNGLADGLLYLAARVWKLVLKGTAPSVRLPQNPPKNPAT